MTEGVGPKRPAGRRGFGRRVTPSAGLLVLPVLVAAGACRRGAPAADAGSPTRRDTVSRARLDSLRRLVEAEIGDAGASAPSACRVIALGAKPCGGPRAYLPYSIEATDSARLAALARTYDSLDARRNAEQGLLSDCGLVVAPEVGLAGGRCVARPARPERLRAPIRRDGSS
ncbi:MAG: hypothetical protein ACE5HF_08220 [Gemmatimonadota bacterium]